MLDMNWPKDFLRKYPLAPRLIDQFAIKPSGPDERALLDAIAHATEGPPSTDVLGPLLSPSHDLEQIETKRPWMRRIWPILRNEVTSPEHAQQTAACQPLWNRLLQGGQWTSLDALPFLLRDLEGFEAWAHNHDIEYLFSFDFTGLGGLFAPANPEKIRSFDHLIRWYRAAARYSVLETDVEISSCETMPSLRSGKVEFVSISKEEIAGVVEPLTYMLFDLGAMLPKAANLLKSEGPLFAYHTRAETDWFVFCTHYFDYIVLQPSSSASLIEERAILEDVQVAFGPRHHERLALRELE